MPALGIGWRRPWAGCPSSRTPNAQEGASGAAARARRRRFPSASSPPNISVLQSTHNFGHRQGFVVEARVLHGPQALAAVLTQDARTLLTAPLRVTVVVHEVEHG